MPPVAPTPPDIYLAQRPVRREIRILRAVARWVRLVAGRLPGEYTIAKLDAFNRFRSKATSSWVLTIFLVTPIPCLVTSLVIESIPLADPVTGFWGSLHFQIRNFLTALIMTAMPVIMKINCVPQLSTRSWKFVIGYGSTAACVAIANNAVIALTTRVFPVPFTQFAPTIPMAIVGGLLNRLFLQKPDVKERLEKIDQWLAMDIVPIFVYPIFTAVFMALKPSQQLWLSLLLPVIKRLLRHVIWQVLRDDLDLVGVTTCSVGHLYHVLFTATCLQNAKSLETFAAVVLVNIFQMLLNCRDILKDADNLHKTKALLSGSDISMTEDMITVVLNTAQQEQVSRLLHRRKTSRLFSKYPGYQGIDFVTRHRHLLQKSEPSFSANTRSVVVNDAAVLGRNPSRGSRHRSLLSTKSLSKQTTPPIKLGFAQILPVSKDGCSALSSPAPGGSNQYVFPSGESADESRAQIVHTIQPSGNRTRQAEMYVRNFTSALHQTEIILLKSFITICVLSFYGKCYFVHYRSSKCYLPCSCGYVVLGIYIILVFWLPNRNYFATMSTMTTFTAVNNMIFYFLMLGSLEVMFLGIYLVLVSHKLGVSGVHQLAFVLWSQRVLLQGKFMSLSLMILGFPLEHNGNGVIYKLRPR
ncbi:unnamed protein product [Phytophthora lilii]|uniref:Unnamed protein product n=1 Tax=Phytophthora lilii TaxID=2077276 RepID=A0A9W6U2K4_9STRA|nr:unnamed protein product [Phytophthora lilii]